ncbi:MAG TPA: protein-L-isoaspartate(D-aspartate) O-methyltransferase [Thermoanaerobaculia bacterium]|nr:protein-L-isoaspartate(D-aspartate) O-methyltransferase [Thermoanaerobaculia bacterium]
MGKRLSSAIATAACLVSAALSVVPAGAQDPFEEPRRTMVEQQLRRRGIRQSELLHAMQMVPRHLFVPERVRGEAYVDEPLPLGPGEEALLQPYMTARMIELLELDGTQKVLEVGTGSGYDAAVLSKLAREVYTIEINRRRGEEARKRLQSLGYANVHVRIGDGNQGWPEQAPFDAIILTAAPEEPPPKLVEQLRVNGKMVVAVGGSPVQQLSLLVKTRDGLQRRKIEPVRLAPMSSERE